MPITPGSTSPPFTASDAWGVDVAHGCLEPLASALSGVCVDRNGGGANATFCVVSPDGTLYFMDGETSDTIVGAGWTAMGFSAGVAFTNVSDANRMRCNDAITTIAFQPLSEGNPNDAGPSARIMCSGGDAASE